jgi:protein-disulfide isomerase
MLYRLLLCSCLIFANHSIAQSVGITPIKATKNTPDTAIDYQLTGAPMPPFLLVEPIDSNMRSLISIIDKAAGRKAKKKMKEADTGKITYRYITSKELDNGANLFVMMFNPTCSHCEEETDMLAKNIDLFKRSKLVLMANIVMKPHMPPFIKAHRTYDYPPMHVGLDSLGFIDKVFSYKALPQINIYSRDRKLLKIYTGEVSIDSLKPYIE